MANDLDLPFLDASQDLFVVEEVEVRDAYELIDSTQQGEGAYLARGETSDGA